MFSFSAKDEEAVWDGGDGYCRPAQHECRRLRRAGAESTPPLGLCISILEHASAKAHLRGERTASACNGGRRLSRVKGTLKGDSTGEFFTDEKGQVGIGLGTERERPRSHAATSRKLC